MPVRMSKARVNKTLKQIGKRVKQVRKARGLRAATVAKAVGLSQPQISRLENGLQGIRSAVLLRLAAALNVSPIVFFVDEATASQLIEALPRNRIRGLDLIADN